MNLFRRARTAPELVAKCCAAFEALSRDAGSQVALDHVAKYVGEMKVILFGEAGEKAPKEEEGRVLAVEAAKTPLLTHLCSHLAPLGFETRKEVAQVFCGLVRVAVDGRSPGVAYLVAHKELVVQLTKGFERVDTALITGSMLREAVKAEPLCQHLLNCESLYDLLVYTDVSTFEVASDAFLTFKELLGRHPGQTTSFLLSNSARFFEAYNGKLLASQNYVTRRQSVKLLGELLLTPGNVEPMMRYIADVEHLKLIMNLLRDPSRSIQYEAFHLFKVFVANPAKPAPIAEILSKNSERLLRFLSDFQTDREDAEFDSEKALLCRVLAESAATPASTK